ncbi:hypothetical protein [Bordetella holmesii]|uniref:hypothetical protein n=1 Tax=Bordetella holmesii TaxID=35814 RepID=UPI001559C275|nr:hypothetical protein [Bordetella holmesii]
MEELFAAAYFDYTRYLNPHTHERGTIFDVIEWLVRQREQTARERGPQHRRGFPALEGIKRAALAGSGCVSGAFCTQCRRGRCPEAGSAGSTDYMGADPAPELALLARSSAARLVRMEDGFLRSVGLGSISCRHCRWCWTSRGCISIRASLRLWKLC